MRAELGHAHGAAADAWFAALKAARRRVLRRLARRALPAAARLRTSPGFVHASALRRISNLYFAVNVRRLARSTSSGSGTPAGAGAPAGPESQLSYGPLVFAAGGVISRSPSSIRACLQHPGVLRSRPQGS